MTSLKYGLLIKYAKNDAIVQHLTHLAPPLPDEIFGVRKTNGNTSLM
jgi:hypothetical protein